jgi:hypothetical protein
VLLALLAFMVLGPGTAVANIYDSDGALGPLDQSVGSDNQIVTDTDALTLTTLPLAGSRRLVEADMAALELGETFPFIAMPYRTFMHLLTPGEQHGCLNAVRRHLAPDGVFALNTWAAHPSIIARMARRVSGGKPRLVGRYKTDDARVTVVHRHRAVVDEARQWLFEQHLIEERDQRGRVVHRAELPMTRAYFTSEQMQALVRECGFAVRELYGDFDGTPLTSRSHETIMVLTKGVLHGAI